jgi:thiol-disulfide isomerase/thioredoxin
MFRPLVIAGAMVLMAGSALAQPADKPAPQPAPKQPAKTPADKAVTLKVGDKAPEIVVSKWVKGEPVTGFEKGRVYIVEFWATWCGPCRMSIPHLTELQSKFKDKGVTVVGVSVSEDDQSKVEPFVKDRGDEMNYTVALDQVPAPPEGTPANRRWNFEHGKMANTWMKAAGLDGIPMALIVNQEGTVVWIGSPLSPTGAIDDTVDQVVAGKYDIKEAAAKAARRTDLESRINTALAAQDWAIAIKTFDELIAMYPRAAGGYAMGKFTVLLLKAEDYDRAYAWAREIIDGPIKDDAVSLNSIAWTILDNENVKKRDLDLAMKVATRADEVSKGKDWQIVDTLARAYFEKGNIDKAIELETKAVGLTPDDMKPDIQTTLKKYQNAKEAKK